MVRVHTKTWKEELRMSWRRMERTEEKESRVMGGGVGLKCLYAPVLLTVVVVVMVIKLTLAIYLIKLTLSIYLSNWHYLSIYRFIQMSGDNGHTRIWKREDEDQINVEEYEVCEAGSDLIDYGVLRNVRKIRKYMNMNSWWINLTMLI